MSIKESINISEDMKRIISNKLKGNINCKNKKKNYYKVAQLNPFTNEVISIFDNSVEASIIIKGNKSIASRIRKVCKGEGNITCGFRWKYIK